jgi:hypothetical protein
MWVGLSVLITIGLIVGGYAYYCHTVDQELQEAIAKVDQEDPGWRLEEIEAKRAVVPEDRNAAVRVMAACKSIPKNWLTDALDRELEDLKPEKQLNPQQIALLEAELNRLRPALAEARKLPAYPAGRYPITPGRNPLKTNLDDMQRARNVARLLDYDVALLGQKNDPAAALRSCRALVNTARSVGDEPSVIAQLVRISCLQVAYFAVERALAQGQPPADDLALLQRLLEQEQGLNLLLLIARAERAATHRICELTENGELDSTELAGPQEGSWKDEVGNFLARNWLRKEHMRALGYMSRFVEIARLPHHEQIPPLFELEQEVKNGPRGLASLLMPSMVKVGQATQRDQAYLCCSVAALAVERYRLTHGRWPKTLAALEPKFLAKVPLDPCDGKPLRYRRLPDGVVVYSVGPDGQDNGGTLDRANPIAPGTDLGIRLWDVAKRRQPPAPPKPREEPPGGEPGGPP